MPDDETTVPDLPRRSGTTDAAAWILLAVNGVYMVFHAVLVGGVAFSDTDAFAGTRFSSGDVRTAALIVPLLLVIPFHVWVIAIGRALLRRRTWARGAITATILALLFSGVVGAQTGQNLSLAEALTLMANAVILTLLWLPQTGRDIWWADKARTRPDYVRRRSAATSSHGHMPS